jgi:hypothetical protein
VTTFADELAAGLLSDRSFTFVLGLIAMKLMRLLAILLLTLSATNATVRGDDAAKKYPIRFEPPDQVGFVQKRTVKLEHGLSRTIKDQDGKLVEDKRERIGIDFDGKCTIEAASKGRWTKLNVVVASCKYFDLSDKDNKKNDLIPAGTTFTIDRTAKPPQVVLTNGSIMKATRAAFVVRIIPSDGDQESSLDAMFGGSKRSVGEKWQPDDEKLLKSLKTFAPDISKDNMSGTAEFVSLERANGAELLTLNAKVSAKTKKPPVSVPGGVGVLGSFDMSQQVRIPVAGDAVNTYTKSTAVIRQIFTGKPGTAQEKWIYEGGTVDMHEETIERTAPPAK